MQLAPYQVEARRVLVEAGQTDDFPNFLVYGQPGSGKKTVIDSFINELGFDDKQVYRVNCGLNIGVSEVRTQINEYAASVVLGTTTSPNFKLIVLLNADLLTVEAQSALRRCIEERSQLTRYIFVCHSRDGVMKPLQSRAVPLYIGEHSQHGYKNWHSTKIEEKDPGTRRWLARNLKQGLTANECLQLSTRAFERGISMRDIVLYLSGKGRICPLIGAHLINSGSSFQNEPLGTALALLLVGEQVGLDFLDMVNDYTFTDM